MQKHFLRIFLTFVLTSILTLMACENTPAHYEKKARLFIEQNEALKARTVLQEARQRFPDDKKILYLSGWLEFVQGNDAAALPYFGKCLQLDPNFYGGHKGFGAIYFRQGKLEQAQASFEKAIALEPTFAENYGNLAEVKIKKGDFAGAEDLLRQAQQKQPGDLNILLARVFLEAGKINEAADEIAKARKARVHNKLFLIQLDCLEARQISLTLEKALQEAKRKTANASEGKEIERARALLEKCEKADPLHFQEQETQGRLSALTFDLPDPAESK